MSAERIKSAALLRFAAQGYDGTSLAEIAGDVGIKTPSIYAHFNGKQALFLQLLQNAGEQELSKAQKALSRTEDVAPAMQKYLVGTLERFTDDPHLAFWLRSIYLPPAKMRDEISTHDKKFAHGLKIIIASAISHPEFGLRNPTLPHETLATAFIGILRGLHADLMHCGSSETAEVLAALWTVFERSLTG